MMEDWPASIRPMRVLVCGDKNWRDKELIRDRLGRIILETLIEGETKGASTLAREVAEERDVEVARFFPNWKRFGRAAELINNGEMLDMHPDIVMAFHDDIGHSKLTLNCLREAAKRGIRCLLVNHQCGETDWADDGANCLASFRG